MAKRSSEAEEPDAKRVCEDPQPTPASQPPTAEFYLKHMRLKRIVKENHSSEIRAVVFNRTKPENYNLLATIAEDQASIYDNANCGEHLDLMLHFVNAPLPGALKREGKRDLHSVTWVAPSFDTWDAFLAIGSADTFIHVISIARTNVVRLLQGHSDTVTQLSSSTAACDLLLSAAKDKSVRLWHLPSGDCIAYVDLAASSLCWAVDGRHFYSGSSHGVLKQWDLSTVLNNLEAARKQAVVIDHFTAVPKQHQGEIDCIRTLPRSVLSKSVDGHIIMWEPENGGVEQRFKVKNPGDHASTFDVSTDGRFLVAGNAQGKLFVWNLQTGEEVAKLEYRRKESRSVVTSCGISHDLRNIVYATHGAYLWRWDYVDPEAIKNYQKKREQE